MRHPLIAEGAFLKVLFPTSEKPRQPGLLHVCYCLAVRPPLVLVAYSTSAPWPQGTAVPFGVRLFSKEEALALNQERAFRLHLNRMAKIALTKAWIPNLETPGQGVVASATARLRQELYELTLELQRRHEHNIERLGL